MEDEDKVQKLFIRAWGGALLREIRHLWEVPGLNRQYAYEYIRGVYIPVRRTEPVILAEASPACPAASRMEEKTTAMIRDDTRNVFSVAELVGYESPISGNGRVLVWLRDLGDHPTRILPS